MQLGEALHEESLERGALGLTYDERVTALALVVVALAAAGAASTSRRTGLTCKNQSGHGFVLSRQSQRVF
jgi:hypothetical protein